MSDVFQLTGNVEFPLTIDPSVWIFDERKVKLDSLLAGDFKKVDELEQYTKSVSKHWDREIVEGAKVDNSPLYATQKKEWLKESYAMPFSYFIDNSNPKNRELEVTIETEGELIKLPFETVYESYLAFSYNGKRILEDGPVHLYFADGTNKETPITSIKKIIL
ncbi:peptidyl-prolyl cis-trans isomerase [Gottfriedia acidiceleris]|uniref:peptidyl-prolyl cis-trans isomerase n=1 Tax=Gottfriedia acidiceleris TaxID=371036 RepID=UPI002FFE4755